MAKKIEQSAEEKKLYNDVKKLVKRANQRLLRIEREFGEQGLFAARQLYSYLDTNELQARTKSGRVSIRKGFTLMQLAGVRKAVLNYLSDETSRVAGAKQYIKDVSKETGFNFDYKQVNVIYRARKDYTWIYEYIPKSEFWLNVQVSKKQGWDNEEFIEQLRAINQGLNDESFKEDLEALYLYCVKGS